MRTKTIVLSAIVSALVFELALAAPRRRPKPTPKKPQPTKPLKPEPKDPPQPDAVKPDAAKPDEAAGDATKPDPATPPTAPSPSVGAGSGSAAPPPAEKQSTTIEPDDKASGPDVDSLRQEYLKLRDELFASRARASTVASALFSTRVQIKLTYTTGRFYSPSKAVIRLDGATVYDDATGAIAGTDTVRFEGFVAPGRHVITFRVEATGKDDDSFTSVTETQVVVKAVAGKDLIVAAKARDSGDIAYEWKKSERGSYGLGIDVAVKTAASSGGSKQGGK